ncbi:recombinase family protein [Pedobacter frigiditerrae]|uniref:Recombinase family protein n=1 Tax=Pedobacter frigiditerrae TaxID=2530452 RepID=A0A4R0N1Y2_9SPHI|nr:recombinase family protein [Pedobacter frigiditerrae]TCC93695.1 recombinase family protein [Pedobacter frigiditerrae]
MNKGKIVYFEYARKSTEGDSRQVLSIEGQLKDNQKVIEREGLNVTHSFQDKKSASIPFNRPFYTDMINRIKKGEASGIVVWHIDRLMRNHLEAGEFQYLLQTGAIQSIWTPYKEYRSEDNGLLLSIEASVATQFSRDLAVKVKRGLLQKCELGQPPMLAKLGYLNTKYSIHGTNEIIEDPERFHIIRKAFEMLLSRQYTTPAITDILNNEYGFRTRQSGKKAPCPLHVSVLYRIFTDPFYYGYFSYMGKQYKGVYKPMITLQEFEQAQEILGRKGKLKPKRHEFPFAGFIKCGVCGCAITASKKTKMIKSTREYKSYVFYHCTKRREKCTEKEYTKAIEMEEMIIRELETSTLIPKFRDWAIEAIKEDYHEEVSKHKKLLQQIASYEQRLARELDKLLDLRISEAISEEKYLEKKSEKEAVLNRVIDKKKKLESNVNDWLGQFSEKLVFATNVVERFKNGEFCEQKGICLTLGWNWELKEKTLLISKLEWFITIQELKKLYDKYKHTLEPIKTYKEFKECSYFYDILRVVRRLREDIRTKFNENQLRSY